MYFKWKSQKENSMIFKYKRMRKKSQKSLTFDAKIKITGSKNSSAKLNSE